MCLYIDVKVGLKGDKRRLEPPDMFCGENWQELGRRKRWQVLVNPWGNKFILSLGYCNILGWFSLQRLPNPPFLHFSMWFLLA